MFIRKIIILVFFSLFILKTDSFAQMSFYQDVFNGGVTCAGYSPTYSQTTPVTGIITVNIAAGSTIRRAYLISGRLGAAPATNVTLNGNVLTLNGTNMVTPSFNTIYGGASGVHAVDVTAIINPAVNVYSLGLPAQANTSNRYQDFYLYIAYNNAAMLPVGTAIFLNSQNAANIMNWGTLTLNNAINTAGDAIYSFFGGYECSLADGERITLNGTLLGTVVGGDINSGACGGPVGSFYFNNNVGTALSDDNVNLSVSNAEALSQFKTLTTNGATTVSLLHQHAGAGSDNHPWGGIFAYATTSPLPIEFSSYSAQCEAEKARLVWSTAIEKNNNYFTIERSENGIDFMKIGNVKGAGNSYQSRNYSYLDNTIEFEKNYYYRIRQTDYDGKSTASNPMILQACYGIKNYKPEVYPNPASEILKISYSYPPVNSKYILKTSTGEKIMEGNLDKYENEIELRSLDRGFYILEIENNGSYYMRKIIRN